VTFGGYEVTGWLCIMEDGPAPGGYGEASSAGGDFVYYGDAYIFSNDFVKEIVLAVTLLTLCLSSTPLSTIRSHRE
jgi:hypothetical protein